MKMISALTPTVAFSTLCRPDSMVRLYSVILDYTETKGMPHDCRRQKVGNIVHTLVQILHLDTYLVINLILKFSLTGE